MLFNYFARRLWFACDGGQSTVKIIHLFRWHLVNLDNLYRHQALVRVYDYQTSWRDENDFSCLLEGYSLALSDHT